MVMRSTAPASMSPMTASRPDLRAERAQVQADRRRVLEPFDMGERHEAARQPPAEVVGAPQRIAARLDAADDQPLRRDGDRRRHDIDAGVNGEEHRHLGPEAEALAGDQQVGGEDAEPLRRHEGEDDRQRKGLGEAAEEATPERRRLEREIARRRLPRPPRPCARSGGPRAPARSVCRKRPAG